jgi:ribose transport system permease protein
MGIFLGGVLVTGGYSARISKLLIGAITLSLIKHGMILVGLTSIQVSESVQGFLLMAILYATMKLSSKEFHFSGKRSKKQLQ